MPLDEVLDFRRQHGDQHRAYARDLRKFVRDAATLSPHEREQAFLDRREALADTADDLRRLARTLLAPAPRNVRSRHRWKRRHPRLRPSTRCRTTAAGALLGLRRQADPASAYTYLFQAQHHLSAAYRR